LDFARVKVIDRKDAPLSQWGFVEFDAEAIPTVGDGVTIIQHPKGEDKQIALNANEVLGQLNQHLFYTTDTEPGSSGSPVFNKDWRVVAIHHAGKTDAEGGLVVNAKGDRKGANRGILFRDIFAFLGGKPATAPTSGPTNHESFASTTDHTASTGTNANTAPTTVVTPPTPAPPAVSAVPKFVVIYDLADDNHSKLLNKYLNILKITKKIRVYNVHEALAGEDVMARAHTEMADADYLVALVTVNFLNSPDWFGVVYEALQNSRRVIPIRVEIADYEGTGLEKLRPLPTGKAVSEFPNADAAYNSIVTELKKLLPGSK
jgi:endonuclease G